MCSMTPRRGFSGSQNMGIVHFIKCCLIAFQRDYANLLLHQYARGSYFLTPLKNHRICKLFDICHFDRENMEFWGSFNLHFSLVGRWTLFHILNLILTFFFCELYFHILFPMG